MMLAVFIVVFMTEAAYIMNSYLSVCLESVVIEHYNHCVLRFSQDVISFTTCLYFILFKEMIPNSPFEKETKLYNVTETRSSSVMSSIVAKYLSLDSCQFQDPRSQQVGTNHIG